MMNLCHSMKKENLITGWAAWLLVGIIFSLSVAAMLRSGSFDLDCFYNVGEVYDIAGKQQREVYDASYDISENICRAESEHAGRYFLVYDEETKWRSLYFKAKLPDAESIQVTLECLDTTGTQVFWVQQEIVCGENQIPLPELNFSQGILWIDGQQGQQFLFYDMHLFERQAIKFARRGYFYAGVVFLFYAITSVLCVKLFGQRVKKWNWYLPVDKMQEAYILVGDHFGAKIRLAEETKYKIRTGLFVILFAYSYIAWESGNYNPGYRYHVLAGCILLLAIGLFSYEQPLHKVDWKNPLVLSFFLFGIGTILSDAIVPKKTYAYVGWVLILVFSFVFFLWNNSKKQYHIIQNILDALEIVFWINAVVCLLFRPIQEGMRYSGTATNPGMYAMYMAVMLVMFFAKIEEEWQQEKFRIRFLRYVAGFAAAWCMLWKTQSMTAIGTMLLAGFALVLRMGLQRREILQKGKKRRIFAGIAVLVGSSLFFSWGLTHICTGLGWTEVFPYKALYISMEWKNPFVEQVYAASENRVVRKLMSLTDIETLTSLRNLYWAAYARAMNLFGHTYKHIFWGETHWAHNGILWIAYYYGVFCAVPYILMFGCALVKAAKRVHIKVTAGAYEIVPFGMLVVLFMISMADNVEQPFGLIVWYLFYLMPGLLFETQKETE